METLRSVGVLEKDHPQVSPKSTDEIAYGRKRPPSKIVRRGRKGIGGRKSTITPEASAILIAALENGLTLKECLYQAGISDDAYRRKLESSAEFREQIEGAKMKLTMLARSKLALAINAGDMATVRWYLERKVPEEFARHTADQDNGNGSWLGFTKINNIFPGAKPEPNDDPNERVLNLVIPGGKHPRINYDEIAKEEA